MACGGSCALAEVGWGIGVREGGSARACGRWMEVRCQFICTHTCTCCGLSAAPVADGTCRRHSAAPPAGGTYCGSAARPSSSWRVSRSYRVHHHAEGGETASWQLLGSFLAASWLSQVSCVNCHTFQTRERSSGSFHVRLRVWVELCAVGVHAPWRA
eukprot:359884-Chlamydomonas_euryale.AAC.3